MSSSNDCGCTGCCEKGDKGEQGIQGIQGIPGIQGQPGQSGLQGVPGMPGADGMPGTDGAPGAQGQVGAKGDKGDKGERGLTGATGQTGAQGQPGQNGTQGIPGSQGLQGIQGLQGVKGDCVECPCNCDQEFAEVFSTMNQSLSPSLSLNAAGQTVLLENTITSTSNIDVSQAGISGKIVINKAGWYDVATGICGALNPIASPLPCWTLSLFKNGALVPGSTFANQTISPEQKSNEIVADVFVQLAVGDYIELANTSTSQLTVAAPTLGTNAQPSSAYLKVTLLKAL